MKESPNAQSRISRLLRPSSVAIVGASEKVGSLGASVLSNLLESQYSGAIHLINPKRTHIWGRPCLSSIHDLPEEIDCAVLAIPRAGVLDAVRSCVERRVGAVIIFSAGFAESGEQGKLEQAELARIAHESSLIIEGPNCLGMVNGIERIPLTFITTPSTYRSNGAGVAVVSQSGAMAAVLGVSFRAHNLDLTYSISTGNEAVTGVEDYLEFLITDSDTKVIALLVEQFRRPRRFLELAYRASQQGKSVVLLHPGSSSAARASAATHTGAIAGDYEVMRARVSAAGVCVVETLEELIDVSHLLARCPQLSRGGIAILTESGAFKALTLDLCEHLRLPLPSLRQQTADALRAVLPDFIVPSNPLDVTAHGLVDPDLYRRTLPPLLKDTTFAAVVLTIILTDEATVHLKLPPILDAIGEINLEKPLIFAALDEGGPMPPEFRTRLDALGVPFFPTAERVFRGIARIYSAQALRSPETAPLPFNKIALPHGTLSESESKAVLREFGLPVPEGSVARSPDEAIELAQRIGYPIVMKAHSRQLLHKTDVGGVVLSLRDAAQVAKAWRTLHINILRARPKLALDGVFIEKMADAGTEFLVGARNDPDWGPITLVGLGGIFAEAMKDVKILAANLDLPQILEQLSDLKGARILQGFRGGAIPDVSAVAEIVRRIGQLVTSHPEIREIDLNPVVAHERGAMILDAVVICS